MNIPLSFLWFSDEVSLKAFEVWNKLCQPCTHPRFSYTKFLLLEFLRLLDTRKVTGCLESSFPFYFPNVRGNERSDQRLERQVLTQSLSFPFLSEQCAECWYVRMTYLHQIISDDLWPWNKWSHSRRVLRWTLWDALVKVLCAVSCYSCQKTSQGLCF